MISSQKNQEDRVYFEENPEGPVCKFFESVNLDDVQYMNIFIGLSY